MIDPSTQDFKTVADAIAYLRRVVRLVFDIPGDHSGIDRLREITKMERANLRPVDTYNKGLYAEAQIAKWIIEGAYKPITTIASLYGLRFAYIGAIILGADERNADKIIALNIDPEHVQRARKMLERQ